jgi:iron donor protein CyaY
MQTIPHSEFPDDTAFRQGVGALLRRLLDQVDNIDSDDVEARLSEGNLQVNFEASRAVFVLSQQTPTHELWLSANLRAWHFRWAGGVWVERDTAEPLVDVLGRLFTEKVGGPVRFRL